MAANPFTGSGEEDLTANLPDAQTFSNLRDQWSTFLGNPKAQAFLMNTGIALAQPPSFGDTGVSVATRALGQGTEAVGRQEAMDIKRQEAESKAAAREAAANLAGARAGALGLSAQLQQERLATQKTAEEHRFSTARLMASNTLHGQYNKVIAGIAKLNATSAADVLNRPGTPNYRPPAPIPSFEEWVANDPGARSIAERAGLPVGGAPAAKPVLSPQDQQALDWANQNPDDPRAGQIKQRLGQ
jgi:hypothetical protein